MLTEPNTFVSFMENSFSDGTDGLCKTVFEYLGYLNIAAYGYQITKGVDNKAELNTALNVEFSNIITEVDSVKRRQMLENLTNVAYACHFKEDPMTYEEYENLDPFAFTDIVEQAYEFMRNFNLGQEV